MSRRVFGRESETERLLRTARPRPTDEFVDRLSSDAAPPARSRLRPGSRLILAGAVTALMVVALASVGGISYAASTFTQVVKQVTSKATYMGQRMELLAQSTQSAARSQYGTPTTTTTSSTATVTTSSTSGSSSTGTVKTQTITPTTGAGKTTISLSNATVALTSTTFAQAVSVVVQQLTGADSTSTLVKDIVATLTSKFQSAAAAGDATSSTTIKLVTITVNTSSDGTAVTSFGSPADITLSLGSFYRANSLKAAANPALTPIPVVTQDGIAIRALKNVGGPNGDLGASGDGYYVASDGTLHVLTLHPGSFGLISKLAVNVGTLGRTLAAPGSGKFGDPTLMQFGKATLKQVGDVSVRSLGGNGAIVPATFFVNEQASVHLSIFKGSQKIAILQKGSRIRGNLIHSGGLVKNLHVTILRPGTINVKLHVPASAHLVAGQKYKLRVWAIDPDGNKTVAFIPFTG